MCRPSMSRLKVWPLRLRIEATHQSETMYIFWHFVK